MFDLTVAREAIGRQAVLLPDPVPSHPLLDGKAEIGRGEYSVVIDKGDGERVYKIVSSPADYFLYIGALTAFLVSDAGRLITGGVHFVDAGYNIMA